MLELKNVSYSVSDDSGTADILKDVSLAIEDRKFIVITGPNGGGKTTLAKAVMGIVPLTSGQILLDGEDITGLNVTERARRGIAFGFQQPPRFKGLKVRDLLTVAAGRSLSHDEACAYLTKVGLCARDYLDRDVDTSLSGGEVKRIEIATVLARRTKLDRHLPGDPRLQAGHHHHHLAPGAHHPPGRRDPPHCRWPAPGPGLRGRDLSQDHDPDPHRLQSPGGGLIC